LILSNSTSEDIAWNVSLITYIFRHDNVFILSAIIVALYDLAGVEC